MRIRRLHSWDLSPRAAVQLQRELASQVMAYPTLNEFALVAGADVSYNRFSTRFYATVVVLKISDWTIVEKQDAVRDIPFPYVPGLLSFREAPVLLDAFAKLRTLPDAVMIDGHGTAHPRRLGIACHVGLCLDIPTLGCAKSLLVGKHQELGLKRSSCAALLNKEEQIGVAVRTRDAIKPVYVSPGHKIDQESAIRVVLACANGYRLPEPTRQAHLHVNDQRRNDLRISR